MAIRDHVLPLLRARGVLGMQRDTVRVADLQLGPWLLRHWTPFNELPAAEASSPGYRHAVERQRSQQTLPYGLEVWHGAMMLRMLWSDDGLLHVASFVRGAWEDEVLALQ